ncbi:MAG: glycosyltransferase [Lachnospiraceae bacterium]|nr:glycosyltransferase [Lachnospiraceae bacterium]
MLFTVVMLLKDTEPDYFRDSLESLIAQTLDDFQLILLDQNNESGFSIFVSEMFPRDERVEYRRLTAQKGRGFSLNYAIDSARGDYILFLGQHERLSENALFSFAEEALHNEDAALLYCDCDELIDGERRNPYFKSDINIELLRQTNYIGNSFVIKREAIRSIGKFSELTKRLPEWEFLLRVTERKQKVLHIPKLLIHKRPGDKAPSYDRRDRTGFELEAAAIVEASLRRQDIKAFVRSYFLSDALYVKVTYDGSTYDVKRDSFLFLKDQNVRFPSRRAVEKLYGVLSQPDVAVVGCRFLGQAFSVSNCGFIFDRDGVCYSACHGQSVFSDGYGGRIKLRNDVSCVDFSFCLIDEKFFRRSGGFDKALLGRDLMLDFCLRAKKHGLRTVYEPEVTARYSGREPLSSKESNDILMERWGDVIRKGDPYYNENLAMGTENYTF